MDAENYFVYVITSEVANKYYVGMSAEPSERLKQHNAGQSQFTNGFRHRKLVYSEFAGNRLKARELEKYYKTCGGRKYWKRILSDQSSISEIYILIHNWKTLPMSGKDLISRYY